MTNYINQFLMHANAAYELRIFSTIYGVDCFDYNDLIRIGELGIYNYDYTDKIFYKKFYYLDFITQLKQAEQKRKLYEFLKQYNYHLELDLNDSYYQGNFINIKNFIFNIDIFFYDYVPNELKEIFLRFCNFQFLKKYSQICKPKYPLLLIQPINYLINQPREVKKIFNKIKALKIPNHSIVFSFYENPKCSENDKRKIYHKFKLENFKIINHEKIKEK